MKKKPLKNLVLMAMLGAISFVLMLFEFPLVFVAPSFYELDFSEVPALIGAFAMGPVAGVIIEFLKIMLNIIFTGSSTAYVGEVANFLMGCAFVVPAGIIYHRKKNKTMALVGTVAGALTMTVAGCVINAWILLPWYANNMFGSLDPILKAGQAIHASIDSVYSFVILLVAPFNLIKGALVSVLTFLLYKRVRAVINRF